MRKRLTYNMIDFILTFSKVFVQITSKVRNTFSTHRATSVKTEKTGIWWSDSRKMGGEISWNNMIFFRQSKYFDSKLHLLMLCDLTPRNIFVDIKSRLTFASSNSEQCEQNQRNCRVAFVSSARNNKCNFLCRTCGIVDDTTSNF